MYSTVLRSVPRLCRSLHTEIHLPPNAAAAATNTTSTSIVPILHRDAHTGSKAIGDPRPPGSREYTYNADSTRSVSLAPHPLDPASTRSKEVQSPSEQLANPANDPSPSSASTSSSATDTSPSPSNLPSSYVPPAVTNLPPMYTSPPFHTHEFFKELERSFPTSIARGLMRATRALLVDRIGRVKREGLTTKDLDNQAYLFKAAISELRSEIQVRHSNETGSLKSANAALRREVGALEQMIKDRVGTLKHEIQLDLDNRKTESKTDLKRMSITVEELLNKWIITVSDLRTAMEEARWDNMRRAVACLSGFLLLLIIAMELRSKAPPSPPPRLAVPDVKHPEAEGLERTDYIT